MVGKVVPKVSSNHVLTKAEPIGRPAWRLASFSIRCRWSLLVTFADKLFEKNDVSENANVEIPIRSLPSDHVDRDIRSDA